MSHHRSPRRQPPAHPPTAAPSLPTQRPHQVAWRLADAVGHQLSPEARHPVYIQLGCRHYRRAVTEALRAAISEDVSIPAPIIAELSAWLQTYADHPDQCGITAMLAAVSRQRPSIGHR